MIAFFLLLILLGVAFVMREMSMRTWLAVTALAMLLGGVTGLTNEPLSLLTALVMGAVLMLFYFTPDLRRRWLTRPLFDRLGPFVPGISPVEEEIIDAGTAGWEKKLFAGRPDWEGLMDAPGPRLDQAEREFIEGPVEELCAMSDDRGNLPSPQRPAARGVAVHQGPGFPRPQYAAGVWWTRIFPPRPVLYRAEARHPQQRRGGHGPDAELAGPPPCCTASAPWGRRTNTCRN